MKSNIIDGAVLGEGLVLLWPFTYQENTVDFQQDSLYGLY